MHSHAPDRTIEIGYDSVLILVVMEDALALLYIARSKGLKAVLILVVMEDALAQ